MRITEKEKFRYISGIKKILVCERAKKEQFLSSFSDNIDDYIDDHPDADITQLQADMGTPQEIAAGFLESTSNESIKRKMTVTRYALICVSILLAICASFILFLYIMSNDGGYAIETINGKPTKVEYFAAENCEHPSKIGLSDVISRKVNAEKNILINDGDRFDYVISIRERLSRNIGD